MEGESAAVLAATHAFVRVVHDQVRRVYGDRLVSLALFGSVARRTARPDSDLDVLLGVEGLPRGRRARLETFDPVERSLATEMETLARAGITVELSPVMRTPEDLQTASASRLTVTS